jgi:hypothetical protein
MFLCRLLRCRLDEERDPDLYIFLVTRESVEAAIDNYFVDPIETTDCRRMEACVHTYIYILAFSSVPFSCCLGRHTSYISDNNNSNWRVQPNNICVGSRPIYLLRTEILFSLPSSSLLCEQQQRYQSTPINHTIASWDEYASKKHKDCMM